MPLFPHLNTYSQRDSKGYDLENLSFNPIKDKCAAYWLHNNIVTFIMVLRIRAQTVTVS